jgi:hypothetical protein
VELETMLVSLFVLVDDWWESVHPPSARKPGRPPSLSDPEVLTLAILAQWPRWRSERDFFRFADAHLRGYFPNLLSHGQLNRRIRALEPELKAFQWDLAATLADGSEVYHVLDTTLIPTIVRVCACRKGLFAGQAAFGRCVSKTEWVYGFKVALSVRPKGVIMGFGLAEANSDERPIGEFLVSSDGYDAYLTDKGFSSVDWERLGEAVATEVRGTGRRYSARERPEGVAGVGPAIGCRKEATHRRRHRPTQGHLCSGAPHRKDPRRSADPAGCEGSRLHRKASAEQAARTPNTPFGESLGLKTISQQTSQRSPEPLYSRS